MNILLSSIGIISFSILAQSFINLESANTKMSESLDLFKNTSFYNSQEVSQTLPKLKFEIKTLKANNLQAGTHGDNAERELLLIIDGIKADSFLEFGRADIDKDEAGNLCVYYASDLSQVTIRSKIISSNNITVSRALFFDGEQRNTWKKTYSKSNGTWKMIKCVGECQ